ncbi:MAG: glycosyltransferase family 2 protein [Sulfuricurvum sp.]|uniref:glycosyltransferase family 2 protein n=1 Tax=Sulfuricurvum sp. TaxID=2025608 RepID=UPI0035675E3F
MGDSILKNGGCRLKGHLKSSRQDKPLFSVVTVVFNGENTLERTILSVIDQNYDNIEYIIVDGNSKDHTLDIIKQYNDQIDYWISEPDTGIYNAMNKAIGLCTGDYIGFLNADDWYEPDTFGYIVENLKNDVDYFFGDLDVVDEEGILKSHFTVNLDNYKHHMPIPHPALFVKKNILAKLKFDESYRIAADYDFVIKLINQGFTYLYLKKKITNFCLGGISTSTNTNVEMFKVQKSHFGFIYASYWYLVRLNNPFANLLLKPLAALKTLVK